MGIILMVPAMGSLPSDRPVFLLIYAAALGVF
jgi:hypothetical protein